MAPSSVAFFGGKSMIGAVRRCRQGGFKGDVWLSNAYALYPIIFNR